MAWVGKAGSGQCRCQIAPLHVNAVLGTSVRKGWVLDSEPSQELASKRSPDSQRGRLGVFPPLRRPGRRRVSLCAFEGHFMSRREMASPEGLMLAGPAQRAHTRRPMARGSQGSPEGHRPASLAPPPGRAGQPTASKLAPFCSAGCYSRRPRILTNPTHTKAAILPRTWPPNRNVITQQCWPSSCKQNVINL